MLENMVKKRTLRWRDTEVSTVHSNSEDVEELLEAREVKLNWGPRRERIGEWVRARNASEATLASQPYPSLSLSLSLSHLAFILHKQGRL